MKFCRISSRFGGRIAFTEQEISIFLVIFEYLPHQYYRNNGFNKYLYYIMIIAGKCPVIHMYNKDFIANLVIPTPKITKPARFNENLKIAITLSICHIGMWFLCLFVCLPETGSEVLPDFGGKNIGIFQDFWGFWGEVLGGSSGGFWEILGGVFGGYLEGNLRVF